MARYLSRADLSRIAGKYIDQYYTRFGISKDAPEPIDPERLASAVLGLNVKMLPLCSDGSVLGLTVFQRCGFTVTLGDGTKLVEIFMPKDVVIDSALAADSCTGCRNFTIAHEAAHHILADLFPNDYGKAVKCRGHIAYRERNGQPSWEEWQANTLAAELLMPTFLVNAEIERAALCLPNGILYKSASDPNYEKILEMAARMGVSWSAIRIRLQQMQVIKGKPIHCHPLDIIRFGEFTRLMNDVRQKKIKCIVVKDLSRFGRNYLEAGYYIETVFPFLGIRLIAVTDNFDSTRKEDMESLALPIRNMVNAMYAKDISKKIWTSLQRKKEAGYAVGNDAPYGYIRNPVTKRNEIDPEAAFYVQLIFQWELMGVPIFEIARRMTLLQVPTPREWHRKMVEGKEVLTCKKWGVTTIRHILENQTYVGDTINNKSTQKLFAGQDKRDLPKEQWYVAKNTHPAIIARDDFEKVQKILDKNRAVFHTVRAKSEQIRTEYQNDLAGMVFCADCGRPMEFERLPHGAEESKKVCYYICKARQADDKCIGHQITEKLLKALIMDQLHLFITQLSDRRKVVEELRKIEDVQNPVYRAKGEIMSLTDKVSQMAKKREQLYADYVAGVVDSEDYQLIREDYSRQYDGLRAALQEAENKKVQVEQQIEEYLNMTSHLEEHLDNFEFDIQLVKFLVQKIEVSADKRIRIVFGFRDVFTELGKESAET